MLDLPLIPRKLPPRVNIWGLPKTMKTFHYSDSPDERTIEVRDDDELSMRVTAARGGRRRLVEESNRVYSVNNGTLVVTKSFLSGGCWQYTGLSPLAKRTRVEFGASSPYSDFALMQLGPHPLLVRDFECLSTVLYAPDPA